jgi:hypothetical protein
VGWVDIVRIVRVFIKRGKRERDRRARGGIVE